MYVSKHVRKELTNQRRLPLFTKNFNNSKTQYAGRHTHTYQNIDFHLVRDYRETRGERKLRDSIKNK